MVELALATTKAALQSTVGKRRIALLLLLLRLRGLQLLRLELLRWQLLALELLRLELLRLQLLRLELLRLELLRLELLGLQLRLLGEGGAQRQLRRIHHEHSGTTERTWCIDYHRAAMSTKSCCYLLHERRPLLVRATEGNVRAWRWVRALLLHLQLAVLLLLLSQLLSHYPVLLAHLGNLRAFTRDFFFIQSNGAGLGLLLGLLLLANVKVF